MAEEENAVLPAVTTNSTTNGQTVNAATQTTPTQRRITRNTIPNIFKCCCGARAGRGTPAQKYAPIQTVEIEIEEGLGELTL